MKSVGTLRALRWAVAAAAVTSMVVLAGCSSGSSDDRTSSTGQGSASASSSASPSKGASVSVSAPSEPGSCSATSCPKLPTPSGDVMESGVTASNSATAVPKYLTALLNDLDSTWGGWFTELGWGDPDPGRKLIDPGTTFKTDCTGGDGESSVIPSDLSNAFFCALDKLPNGNGQTVQGSIVLPVETFEAIWKGDVFGVQSPIVGDFTAAVVVAHEYGHNVVYRIADVLGIPDSKLPTGNNSELIADCFAGNWAATVYQRNALSPKDILQAAALVPVIGDSGPNQGHGTSRERALALTVGLTGPQFSRQGQPVDCLTKYWPQAFS